MNTSDKLQAGWLVLLCFMVTAFLILPAHSGAEGLIGEQPMLGPVEDRLTQTEIESGVLSFKELRRAGLEIFTTRFNTYDGFGDGPMNPFDPTSPGGRPTLQNNGTFLRVNGLDAQTCLECHSIISTATLPFTTGIGGAGGMNSSPMFQPLFIDVEDAEKNGFAGFDGRLINPPALFGTGGVQLVAKEMTADLQKLKAKALANPGVPVTLMTKNVYFGTVVADDSGIIDTSGVEGIDEDLVVRPFGRKGELFSVRQFDLGAMMFHFGMQPVEIVGYGVDEDGDGVNNEVFIGEISALEIFLTTQDSPFIDPPGKREQRGFQRFKSIGCADCHRPVMKTHSPLLTYSFPEIPTEPFTNTFFSVDLTDEPMSFEPTRKGGIVVQMFSDLKRHDMGPDLSESFHRADERENREFITAKLWGAADTAPYLHDGRAMTLNQAIILHGGEAESARNAYLALSNSKKNQLLSFLRSLRNPIMPNQDVLSE
jgi:hypothetical protein